MVSGGQAADRSAHSTALPGINSSVPERAARDATLHAQDRGQKQKIRISATLERACAAGVMGGLATSPN